jgi:hypothetical protein
MTIMTIWILSTSTKFILKHHPMICLITVRVASVQKKLLNHFCLVMVASLFFIDQYKKKLQEQNLPSKEMISI